MRRANDYICGDHNFAFESISQNSFVSAPIAHKLVSFQHSKRQREKIQWNVSVKSDRINGFSHKSCLILPLPFLSLTVSPIDSHRIVNMFVYSRMREFTFIIVNFAPLRFRSLNLSLPLTYSLVRSFVFGIASGFIVITVANRPQMVVEKKLLTDIRHSANVSNRTNKTEGKKSQPEILMKTDLCNKCVDIAHLIFVCNVYVDV